MKIDGIIKAVEETMYDGWKDYYSDGLKDIKELLRLSKEVMVHGRDESIKEKLISDISECLGEKNV